MPESKQDIPFSIRGLEVFLAVCRGNGIAAAARELGLTQPSVSQRIAELEKALRIELFDRSRRPISLTSAGMILQQRAEELISEASAISPLLHKVGKVKVPSMRVGIIDSLEKILTVPLYRFLLERCEHGSIFAGQSDSHTDALVVRKLDILIGASQANDRSRLDGWPIVEEPFIVVLPRKIEPPASLADLVKIAERHPLLRYSARSNIGMEIEQQCRRLQLNIPRTIEFDTAEQVALALGCGDNWAITTPICVYQGQLDPSLFYLIPFPGPGFRRQLTLTARSRELGSLPGTLAKQSRQAIAERLNPYLAEAMPWLRVSVSDKGAVIGSRS